MNKIIVGKDIAWRKGLTVLDLLCELNENRPLVGVVINGVYGSRSHFGEIKIPEKAEVQLIPWREGMTVAELFNYDIAEDYFSTATINDLLIPEDLFYKTTIPENAKVWLLTPVGGG